VTARKTRTPAESRTATTLDDLVPNKKNPRKPWTADQLASFRESLTKFGDLGGIVRNLTTNQLIGGHKRIEAFRQAKAVQVVSEPQPKDAQGTVAHGYVLVDGHRFGYREVKWDYEHEIAANLAANRWGAEWDWQLVSEALKSISDDEMRTLTGFAEHEISNLLAADWTKAEKGDLMGGDAEGHAVHLSAAQYQLLTDAKAKVDPTGAVSDAGAIEHMCRGVLAEEHEQTRTRRRQVKAAANP
jgi:hypothetical protein